MSLVANQHLPSPGTVRLVDPSPTPVVSRASGSSGCEDSFCSGPSVTYGSKVFGEADGPEVDLQAEMPARFDVTVSSDDWYLPAFLSLEIERSTGVDVAVPDALDGVGSTSDDGSIAMFSVDLHDPPDEDGIARTFVVELSANQDVADVLWHVTASMDVIADAEVDASYNVEISPSRPPQ